MLLYNYKAGLMRRLDMNRDWGKIVEFTAIDYSTEKQLAAREIKRQQVIEEIRYYIRLDRNRKIKAVLSTILSVVIILLA